MNSFAKPAEVLERRRPRTRVDAQGVGPLLDCVNERADLLLDRPVDPRVGDPRFPVQRIDVPFTETAEAPTFEPVVLKVIDLPLDLPFVQSLRSHPDRRVRSGASA